MKDFNFDDVEFPPDMPEDTQKYLKDKFNELKAHFDVWEKRVADLSDVELAALGFASTIEREKRINQLTIKAAANDPEVRAAVLASISDEPVGSLGDFDIGDIIGNGNGSIN